MFSGSLRFSRIFKISIQDPQKDDDSHLLAKCLGHIPPPPTLIIESEHWLKYKNTYHRLMS